VEPYRSTAVFDEVSLPKALRADHRTKPGVWGVIRVLKGALLPTFADGAEERLTPGRDGRLEPERTHRVAPLGEMKMRVDFYDRPPPF
jgi:tellurite resistance-related uncharacterized protein